MSPYSFLLGFLASPRLWGGMISHTLLQSFCRDSILWMVVPFEREKCYRFCVESDSSEGSRMIFHYLPGAAESSCVPVCLCSWYSPSCTVSGPGPGSLSWRHPKALHLLSASPGYPCLPPSPCPMVCFHPDSSWWGLLHAERDKDTEYKYTQKPKGWQHSLKTSPFRVQSFNPHLIFRGREIFFKVHL